MWILNFLPDWIFYAVFFLGLIGIAVTYLLRFIPIPSLYIYKTPIQLVSIAMLAFGTFMSGAIHNENAWKEKVAKLEKEFAESQVKSAEVTQEVVTKVITKTNTIREKGAETIRYIDREIVKYNEVCKLPKEVIKAHNDAAKELK